MQVLYVIGVCILYTNMYLMFWLDIKIRYDMRISWNVGVVYYDWTTNMDEQISYNRWNILQISILDLGPFFIFFWCYWDTSIFQKQYTGPNKGDVFVRFRHWNGAKLGRFCSQPVFHPSHPPGPSGWPEVFFPSSKPPNCCCQSLSTPMTLGVWHPRHWTWNEGKSGSVN